MKRNLSQWVIGLFILSWFHYLPAFVGFHYLEPHPQFEQDYTSGLGASLGIRFPLSGMLRGEISLGYVYFLPEQSDATHADQRIHMLPAYGTLKLPLLGGDEVHLGIYGSGGVVFYWIDMPEQEGENIFQNIHQVGSYRYGAFLKLLKLELSAGVKSLMDREQNENTFWEISLTLF